MIKYFKQSNWFIFLETSGAYQNTLNNYFRRFGDILEIKLIYM